MSDTDTVFCVCPVCGYANHPAATVRGDDRFSCNNCGELFDCPQESDAEADS